MTAARVGLGPRLPEEGLGRLSWEAGKSSKPRRVAGPGRGGQAAGTAVTGGRDLRESPQAVCCLICRITACWLGLVSRAACGELAPPGL